MTVRFCSPYHFGHRTHKTHTTEKILYSMHLTSALNCFEKNTQALLAPVVQTLDSAIDRINLYPADSVIDFCNTYPLNNYLSGGECYPTFEQPRPDSYHNLGATQHSLGDFHAALGSYQHALLLICVEKNKNALLIVLMALH